MSCPLFYWISKALTRYPKTIGGILKNMSPAQKTLAWKLSTQYGDESTEYKNFFKLFNTDGRVFELGDGLASRYVDLLNERDKMLSNNYRTDCVNFMTFMDEIQTHQKKTYSNSDDDEDIAEFDEMYTDE